MRFIDKIRNVFTTDLSKYEANDLLLKALLGNGGEFDRNKAMMIPAVSSNVDLISNTIAMMPIKLYKRSEVDGTVKVEEVQDNRVKLLNDDTRDTFDGYQFKKAMVEDCLLGKGGYAYLNKSGNKVVSVHYVRCEAISITSNNDPVFKSYSILCNGKTYHPMDFIQLLRTTRNGMDGVGVTGEVADALKAAYETMKFQLKMVSKGGNKKGFLQADKKLSKEAIESLKEAWRNLYSNSDENVVVLNDGVKFQESSNSNVEMQLNESKITFANEIDRIFHMDSDYNSFIKKAIMPICTAFRTALNRDFLLEKEKKQFFWDFDYNEILKGNMKERYEAYQIAKNTGWITKNEIRLQENMERIDGLDTVDVGLGAVLYDITSKAYFTPNTGEELTLGKGGSNGEDD